VLRVPLLVSHTELHARVHLNRYNDRHQATGVAAADVRPSQARRNPRCASRSRATGESRSNRMEVKRLALHGASCSAIANAPYAPFGARVLAAVRRRSALRVMCGCWVAWLPQFAGSACGGALSCSSVTEWVQPACGAVCLAMSDEVRKSSSHGCLLVSCRRS
jgi:hypothetical protein